MLKIIVEPLPVPSQIAEVPPGFDAWWARAVERDPAARFQSAKELADALEGALGLQASPAIGAPSAARAADLPDLAGVGPAVATAPQTPGTMGPAVATVSPAPERSRARAIGVTALIVLAGAFALVSLRGAGRRSDAVPRAERTVAEPVPVPSVTPAAILSEAAPQSSASAAAATSAAPSASPRPHAGASPHGQHASPAASSAHHDIGF